MSLSQVEVQQTYSEFGSVEDRGPWISRHFL